MNERLTRLEEKIAHLDRHVAEQDRAMLEMADELARLRLQVKTLLENRSQQSPPDRADPAANERPPHY